MHPFPCSRSTPTSGPPSWRTWRTAWREAAYGPDGFWTTQRPADHFATAVGAGPLVARAVAGLVPADAQAVVDVGAGDGRLLTELVDLLPDVALVGVDRRARPAGLHPRVRWVTAHHDVDEGRWTGGSPSEWCRDARSPLLVAHEWLDDLPVPVVVHGPGGWREVEVDRTGDERPGQPVSRPDEAWLARWWAAGPRAEVGRVRDLAWAELVQAALGRGGRALAVDYGHVAGRRPPGGSLAAYAGGRRRPPHLDGSVNLTAGVAVDALASSGEEVGARTLLLDRQAEVLGRLPSDEAADPLGAMVRRSQHAALTAPHRWGGLWWLLQGADPPGHLA